MKSVRVIAPFLLSPMFMHSYGSSLKAELSNESSPALVQTSDPYKNLNIGNLFNRVVDSFKIPEPTPRESRALDEVEDFLTRYTGNGKFNYGSMDRMIEGLKYDYRAVHEEGQNMRGLRGIAARRYPNNRLRIAHNKVQSEIVRRGYDEISSKLAYFEVDPSTANDPDNSPIYNFVTKQELERFNKNLCVLDEMAKKFLPAKKRMIFPDGFTLEAINFIRSRKVGLPPGAKIVEIKTSAE